MSGARELRQLEKAKSKAQKTGNLMEEAALCNQLGEILAKNGQFQEAIEEHRQELQIFEGLCDPIGCAVANRRIGECFAELGNYEAALKHQHRHLDLACSVSDDTEEQRALATIGRTYLYMYEGSQTDRTLEAAENAFLKSLAIVDDKLEGKVSSRELSEMRARLFLNLGFLSDSKKDPAQCSYYIKKSIFIAEKTRLYEDLYRANFNLGCINLRQGEPSKAIRCLEAAKESARKMKEKFMESECFATIGQILLSLGDFVAAKRSLKKAYMLGSQRTEERHIVRRNLKYAIKGCSLEEMLAELAEGDLERAMTVSEQLGDIFCKVSCYNKALEAYRKQLRSAEALRKPDQELAVIHVSLAATYGDLKAHREAVSHYQAELELRRGNPTEECKTWLNIAHAKEEDKQSYEELEICFTNALQCAKRTAKPTLQRQVLEELHALQVKFGSSEAQSTQAHLQELCHQQGWNVDGGIRESSEEEELENSEPLEESDLELSESDEEEDLEGYEKTVSGRRKINRWNRRNEKGETPLHRACIDGNLRQVQYVVEKGHPLNPRDYCGWTPLHEACNHGYLEIVQYLLEHGANINDPGGPLCERITPLHDALACGHFEVADLLIKRGAMVTQKNAKGLTPLGTLEEWTKMYRKHLDQETRQKRRDTENLLKEAMYDRELSFSFNLSNLAKRKLGGVSPLSPGGIEVLQQRKKNVAEFEAQSLYPRDADLSAAVIALRRPDMVTNPAVPPTIRIRVRVQDEVFLIPILPSSSETRPVSWLAEQASQRYYQMCGLLPHLTLKKEGALLAPQDPILHVLQNNEEVLAEVHSWDLPPLADRYRKACQSLAVAEHRLVLKTMEQQENSQSLTLRNFCLRQPHLTPFFRSLKLQTSICQLELSGNCIDDTMAEELLATVSTMPNLTLLDLSSNQITHEGLKKLCPVAGISSENIFKNLEELNLSINPLGDSCSQFLASLIKSCPVLSTLKLQACGLTAKFLQHYRLLLADALKGAVHLKILSLSHNSLGSTGIELILKSLPHDTVSHLEIGSVTGSNKDGPLMEHVLRYLSQEGCALKHLSLSGNHLTDEAMRDLARCLLLCPSLVSLDVSGNPGIGVDGLDVLLAALRERKSGLKYLSLAGCSIQGPLHSMALDRIALDLKELQLCSRQLTKMGQEKLVAAWQATVGITTDVVARQQKVFCKSL